MRKIFLFILIAGIFIQKAGAQGCVAIRSNGGTCTMMDPHHEAGSHAVVSGWTFGINTRYFRSYKHFIGTEEQEQRVEQGTEVINHAFSAELGLTRTVNDRWSFGFFAPVISNTRSSLYEHDGKNRHTTASFGIGDLRVAAYYWLLDPTKARKGNIQLGLGIKLPTGDYRYQDYFYKNDSVKVLGPVDQSIQLGDGGTGLTSELNAFYHLSPRLSAYLNGYYLANPREQNGVSTARGGVPSAATIAYTSDVMSVPDQYMIRVGASYAVRDLMFSAGLRKECITVYDLIGGSNGFRRPGYVVSVEPVVAYRMGHAQVYLSVPYAIERNRTQSVPDKIRTEKTGVYAHGDAAFADYSVNVGLAFSFR